MDSRPDLIYFHGAQEEQRLPEKLLEAANTACVCISGEDWNRDLTPWPAEGVFKRGENFGGKADAYLALLTETIIPRTEEALALIPRFRALAGVSLAGLFSVYAAYRTDLFSRIPAFPVPSGTMISLPSCGRTGPPGGWRGPIFLWATGKGKPETAVWHGWRTARWKR